MSSYVNYTKSDWLNQRLRTAEELGWAIERTAKTHVRLYAPDGKTVIHTGGTASCPRAAKNCFSLMCKADHRLREYK